MVVIRHRVNNVSQLKRSVSETKCTKFSFPWSMIVSSSKKSASRTNQFSSHRQEKYLGLHVKCHGHSNNEPWWCFARVEFRILPQTQPRDPISKRLEHKFNPKRNDRGFRYFLSWAELIAGGFVENDSINLEAEINLKEKFTARAPNQKAASDKENANASFIIWEQTTFRRAIRGISNLKDSLLSSATYIHGLPWKILVKLGNQQASDTEKDQSLVETQSLGIFLQCNAESESKTWSCRAGAEIRIIPQVKGCQPLIREIKHIFYSEENDCGFEVPFTDLMDPERGLVTDDAILLEVYIPGAIIEQN